MILKSEARIVMARMNGPCKSQTVKEYAQFHIFIKKDR